MTKSFCDCCRLEATCQKWLVGKFEHYKTKPKAKGFVTPDSIVYSMFDLIEDICYDCQEKIRMFIEELKG